MHAFDYLAVDDLGKVTDLMSTRGGGALLLAGGTDLIVSMRTGARRPALVIDAKKVPELKELALNDRELRLGAAVSCRCIWEHEAVGATFPALVDSTTLIGGIQIQGRATVGGNLCNASPSADTIPTLIAYGATAHLARADGSRAVPVADVCLAPGETCLADDEILVNITIPVPPRGSGARFLRFIPRNEMDIAVVNAASYIELDDSRERIKAARIAIGAVAPTPLLVQEAGEALIGKTIDDDVIAAAAEIAVDAASPIGDMRGTIEHRRQLVKVLVTRTIKGAIERAVGVSR